MRQTYVKNGSSFIPATIEEVYSELPVGVYNIQCDEKGNFSLMLLEDNFILPSKIYGSDEVFADRVVKTFKSRPKNVGVLLSGVKGTGKTVTAKMIANKLQIPVVLLTNLFDFPFAPFIQSFHQDICVFIDEYEKIFDDDSDYNEDYTKKEATSLMTLMDGSVQNGWKRMFLLTSNKNNINSHFLERPSRIRYKKIYKDMDVEVVKEVLRDKLEDKSKVNEVALSIMKLNLVTIDIVMEVIEEVNIHGDLPEDFIPYFNVEYKTETWDLIDITNPEKEEKLYSDVKVNLGNNGLYVDNAWIGHTSDLNEDETVFTVDIAKKNIKKILKKVKATEFNGIFANQSLLQLIA